jgi:UDP-N-acetylmuramyl pentapeptide phosphotransferase/UDP-N-acetylglucosamine-1-phosphate transferase
MAIQSFHAFNRSPTAHILGKGGFGNWYYFLIIPLIVMIVTNVINMLGGLNGLETVCPAIVIIGLMVLSQSYLILMLGPLILWLVLAGFNLQGKIFVGNSGSFAIGMTIASFAVITDLKSSLLISILPYIFNSSLILLTIFLAQKRAKVTFDGKKLVSDHRRSLVTLITYRRPLTERQVVAIISSIIAIFVLVAVLIELPWPFLV